MGTLQCKGLRRARIFSTRFIRGGVRCLFAGLLVLIVLPLSGGPKPKHPPRNVLPELTHERVDYWVAEFSAG